MKTPKSVKKAAKAEIAESVTPAKMKTPKKVASPVQMKTPKKPKSPKAEVASPKAPSTPQVKAENGTKVNGKAKSHAAQNRGRNPKAVYMFFQHEVTTSVAKELVKKFSDAEALSFGRTFVVRFDDEAKAAELKKSAANMTFAGVKPKEVSNALEAPYSRKRTLPEDEAAKEASKESSTDAEASPKKKKKGKKSKKANAKKEEDE